MGDWMAAGGATVFEYEFSHLSLNHCDKAVARGIVPAGDTRWASHSTDLPYVFGTTTGHPGTPGDPTTLCDLSAEERALSQTLR
eukprot:gene1871-18811_t